MYQEPRFPDPSSGPSRRVPRRVRPVHLAAIAGVSVAALGLMALKFVTLPTSDPVASGEGLKIEVVAPVEPTLAPGSVMDVGELTDGFRYVRPASVRRPPAYDVAWAEDEIPPPAPPRRAAAVRRYTSEDADRASLPDPEPRRDGGRRWFGFDSPRPDYGAERRARQDRMQAWEERRRADYERRRRYQSDRAVERPVDEPTDGPYGPEVG